MNAIRIFGKDTLKFKAKDEEEARREVKEIIKERVFHETQKCVYTINPTKRKRNPFDVEVSYYSLTELKLIAEYYLKELKGDE